MFYSCHCLLYLLFIHVILKSGAFEKFLKTTSLSKTYSWLCDFVYYFQHGVAVEVVRVLPDSPPPSLNNIFCNCDETNPSNMVGSTAYRHSKNITITSVSLFPLNCPQLITFDCDAQPVLQVKTFRQKAGKVDTSHYKVTISRFRARMATAMNYNTLKGEMKVDGYPDVSVDSSLLNFK